MRELISSDRKIASEIGRKYFNGQINFAEFENLYPESEDEDIQDLYYLIYHEPKKGGVLGISERKYNSYKMEALKIIDKLEESK